MTPLSKLLSLKNLRAPELVYFDHLYSEYSSLQSKITDAEAKATLDKIVQKRKDETLSWNDLYYFELILADVRPIETLRSKILSLRFDYRSVAGQIEYDEYMAAKPPNLQDPPDPTDPPDAGADYEKLIREDLKDLLGRLYLRYSILPVREAKLKRLTLWAAGLCGVFLLILMAIIIALVVESSTLDEIRQIRIPSLAIFVVLFAGAMGGFVSALQRVQSPSNEGDSLYNLSVLFNGSYAVFVAPLNGAIFAVLLYFMFTGKILEGRFFPIIYTPPAKVVMMRSGPSPSPTPSPTPTPSPSPSPSASPTLTRTRSQQIPPTPSPTAPPVVPETSPTPLTSPSASPVSSPSPSPSPTASPLPSPSPTPRPIATDAVGVKDFLTQSGPAGGDDYALLIIWCFIAGFAERFVPDALNRLVIGKQTDGR